jgi:hypothetical protein
MKNIIRLIFVILIFTGVSAFPEILRADEDILSFDSVGLRIKKPTSWHVASKSEVLESRNSIRLTDKELQDLVKRAPSPNVVTLFKYEKTPEGGWNPSIQISFRPYDKKFGSPQAILNEMRTMMLRATRDLKTIDEIQETELSGQKATYMKIAYTLDRPIGSVRLASRMWYIQRGKFYFLIAMVAPENGADSSENDFKEALLFIAIEK